VAFTAPVVPAGQPPALLSFALTVSSPSGSATSSVNVTVSPAAAANAPPVASAGPDQAVASGATVALDGSGSADPGGLALAFAWTQTAGAPVTLLGADTAHPSFVAPTVAAGAPSATLVFSLVASDAAASSAPATVIVTVNAAGSVNPAPPGTPPPAAFDPNPPPTGGSGSHRFEMGAPLGLYLVDPAQGEASVQGAVVVTFGPVGAGNFIPPDDTVVTLNGVALVRDPPPANGAYWHLDPAGPQPQTGSGGELVLVATATVDASPIQRTLVFPCPSDVAVTSTPAVGSTIAAGGSLSLSTAKDLTLNVGIAPMASVLPHVTLHGYDPATRAISAAAAPVNLAPGPLALSLPVVAAGAPAYLVDLRWPGHWIIDGQSGGFCGLAKRWTYAK
jgi:hypothetical protein